ncbi:MAG: iron ABC transporter substrate-binding protein [Chloroflexi bacterium]|nr:iron ABC transporter substrate-binding protein [Chloroflexota bacterium]
MPKRFLALVGLLVTLAIVGGACAPAAPTPAPSPAPAAPSATTQTLTVYSGRSEALVKPIIDQFSKATGVKVNVRYAGTSEMAATILEEGKNSPADVFFAQDPGGIGAVVNMLAPLPESITSKVLPQFRPADSRWVGISGRARVLAYNTAKLQESDLPDDIWDLTDPKWKGRIGWAPTNASFQAMVTAMRKLWGEDKTRQWLAGIQANSAKVYSNNTAQVDAVSKGEIDVAMPNHYYLYSFLRDKGNSFPVRNYYVRGGGPGAVILVAGAGILETSQNKETAQKFLEFLLSPTGQQYFASQTFEYPVVPGIITHPLLKPLPEIKSPEISMADMADLKGTLSLLRESGIVP